MTAVAQSHSSPEDLLRAVDKLDKSELPGFITEVLARASRRLAPLLGRKESDLLERINEGLPACDEQRYRELIAARQAEALSPAELEELIALTERAEVLQARRMSLLVELAQLRGVSLTKLMTELGIEPRSVE